MCPRFYGTTVESATSLRNKNSGGQSKATSKEKLMATSGEDFEADVDQLFDVEDEKDDDEDEEEEDEEE